MGGWHGDDSWMWHSGYGWVGWLFAVVAGVFFVALVVIVIALAVRYLGGRQEGAAQPTGTPSAELILSERLARGEIDGDEFRERMRALHEHR